MSQKKIIAGVLVLIGVLGVFLMMTRGDGEEETTVAKTPVAKTVKRDAKPAERRSSKGKMNREVELLFDDDPEGSLRLEGHVFDSTGDSVEGAIVSLDSRPPRFTKSEEDGSFFFDKLVGRTYDMVARAPEGVAGPVTARLSDTTEPVILNLVAGGMVSVKVVSAEEPDGVSGVSVDLRGLDVQNATTDETGMAEFQHVPVGRYRVVGSAEGYTPARSRAIVSRSGAHAETQLTLVPGSKVSGRVIDDEGKAVAGARVIYRGASSWGVRASPRLDGVLSDAAGEFSFEALPGGSFRFSATADGFAEGSSGLVSLDASNETTGVVVTMEPGAKLQGRVLSVGGEGVPAARVRVAIGGGRRMGPRQRTREVFSDDKGHYELSGLSRK
ncbi:MAG: carboxypeptidase regulatory-like domain-containing protein, partial [Kofleriaceae bacterium]|nr:carboxypeptidase regulatory-like domain-containing protein [Kofleriaceae bacterium]